MPPKQTSTSHELDNWLIKSMWHWDWIRGAFNKVISHYANRGWTVTGGSRTVAKTVDMLHNADCGEGWRKFQKRKALSYLSRNAGVYVEIGRSAPSEFSETNGWTLPPVVDVFNMDTTQVRWKPHWHYQPYPILFRNTEVGQFDFYHMASNPRDTIEEYHLGWCPLYRCMQSIMLMIGIFEYEKGTLDPFFIDGLLLLLGISTEDFETSMRQRIMGSGNPANRLAVIGAEDLEKSEQFDAKLINLRNMPQTFENFESRVNLIRESCALNLGFDISFFGSSRGGTLLGRSASEVESGQQATAETGANEFHLEDQEKMQEYVIPATVHFEYDDNSISEDRELQRRDTWSKIYTRFQQSTGADGEPLMTSEEARRLMAETDPLYQGLTPEEEDITEDDDGSTEQRRHIEVAMSKPSVQRFVSGVKVGRFRDDALVKHRWADNFDSSTVIMNSVDYLNRPHSFHVNRSVHVRPGTVQRQNVVVDAAIDAYEEELEAIIVGGILALEVVRGGDVVSGGLYDGAETEEEVLDQLEQSVANSSIIIVSLAFTQGAQAPQTDLTDGQEESLEEIISLQLVGALNVRNDVADGAFVDDDGEVRLDTIGERVQLWTGRAAESYWNGFVMDTAQQEDLLMWVIDPLKDHCQTCLSLSGIIADRKSWQSSGRIPRGRNLDCLGFRCGCRWVPAPDGSTSEPIP